MKTEIEWIVPPFEFIVLAYTVGMVAGLACGWLSRGVLASIELEQALEESSVSEAENANHD